MKNWRYIEGFLIVLILVLLALYYFRGPGAGAAAFEDAPRCRVEATATPTEFKGIYTVTVHTSFTLTGAACPPEGYAVVRLASGRVYPEVLVRPGAPFIRRGIPWYWALNWYGASGKPYPVRVKGLSAPFTMKE